MTNEKQKRTLAGVSGGLWIAAAMSLFIFTPTVEILSRSLGNECSSCTEASITKILIITGLLFVGSMGIAYSISSSKEGTRLSSLVSLAFVIALAGMMLYFWLNLFIHGL